jgi:hypothetical protein
VHSELQAALRRQRHGRADAGRLDADVLGLEAAQQHGQRERILDLAHGTADARAGVVELWIGAG